MTTTERNTVVEKNLGLVYKVVNAWTADGKIPASLKEDAEQVGCIALLNAVGGHDASKGTFATYATRAIRTEVTNYVNRYRSVVSLPIRAGNLRLQHAELPCE